MTNETNGWEEPTPYEEVKPDKDKPDENDENGDVKPEPKIYPFPVNSLPPVFREMAGAVAEFSQVDPAMAAAVELAVAATTLQGKVYIQPKGDGWILPLNLYIAVVAHSGERKSAMDFLKKPIVEYEAERNKTLKPDVRTYQQQKKIVSAKISDLTRRAADTSNGFLTTGDALAEIRKLEQELFELEDNPIHKLDTICDGDITPEALAVVLRDNGERAAVFSDEGGIFDTLAGRYSAKGIANIDLFLKAYDGTSYGVRRIGRDSFTLKNPLLTICLMMQPSVLEDVTSNRNFVGRGLLARFLIALPEKMVGKQRYKTEPIPEDYLKYYNEIIRELLNLQGPIILKLDERADKAAESYYQILQVNLRDPNQLGDEGALQSFGAKLFSDCMRIAGLIHCIEKIWYGTNVPYSVSEKSINKAIEITKYFYHCGKVAFGGGGSETKIQKNAEYLLDRLKHKKADTGKTYFSKSEIYRLIHVDRNKDRWNDPETGLDATLDDLVDRGYIRRDGTYIELHPDL